MARGTVKWFNDSKALDSSVRMRAQTSLSIILRSGRRLQVLSEGDKVEFDIVKGQKGPAAANVRKVK